tara:strand:- start:928 stop:2280 length:1353 start_codon:yes stop_codon:yes gene_type:complete
MVRVGSLFSGIGALDIAVHSVLGDARTSWFVEREGFCQEILSMRFPGIPVHDDVRSVGAGNLSPIDVLVGGFPCQDLSVAGNGAGISEGTRSGLFFEMWRIAQELQPRFVLFENVPVITSRGLDIVTETIIQDGWTIEWHCLAASDVGALHRRERWWGIAHREAPLFDGYERIGQLMDGWRVLQGSLFGAPEIIRKLPKAGMACRQGLFEREIDPASFSTYPTPTASDWKGPNRSGSGSCSSRGLATVVDRMWPTPTAHQRQSKERRDRAIELAEAGLPLYTRRIVDGKKVDGGRHFSIADAIVHQNIIKDKMLWPTPSAIHAQRGNHDEPIEKYEQRCLEYYEGNYSGKPGKSLGVAVRMETVDNGRLNPDWVELLMGLPDGWTDPDKDVEPSMIDASSWADGSWEDNVPRLTSRKDYRNKRLKAIGNSVVPQCASTAFEVVRRRMNGQ